MAGGQGPASREELATQVVGQAAGLESLTIDHMQLDAADRTITLEHEWREDRSAYENVEGWYAADLSLLTAWMAKPHVRASLSSVTAFTTDGVSGGYRYKTTLAECRERLLEEAHDTSRRRLGARQLLAFSQLLHPRLSQRVGTILEDNDVLAAVAAKLASAPSATRAAACAAVCGRHAAQGGADVWLHTPDGPGSDDDD